MQIFLIGDMLTQFSVQTCIKQSVRLSELTRNIHIATCIPVLSNASTYSLPRLFLPSGRHQVPSLSADVVVWSKAEAVIVASSYDDDELKTFVF